MPRVVIFGPGALGCLFAGRFALAGIDAWLLDYDPYRAAQLQSQGIIIEEEHARKVALPKVSVLPPTAPDLILVLTKSYSTVQLCLPLNAPVLTLQNGLGNAEILAARCGSHRVLAGATSEAATLLTPGRVRHAARGTTTFGAWDGCNTQTAVTLFQQAGFEAVLTDNPRKALWWKAVISATVNPLTALLNVPNGGLLDTSETRSMLRGLVNEAVRAAHAEGIQFEESMVEMVENICLTTRTNISSMLQDIRNGKPTEIEAISGEILRRAGTAGLRLPKTEVVYRLVSAMEALYTCSNP